MVLQLLPCLLSPSFPLVTLLSPLLPLATLLSPLPPLVSLLSLLLPLASLELCSAVPLVNSELPAAPLAEWEEEVVGSGQNLLALVAPSENEYQKSFMGQFNNLHLYKPYTISAESFRLCLPPPKKKKTQLLKGLNWYKYVSLL